MASVAQLPERSYMATDSWRKYEQLDIAFLCTGSLLDPFFTLNMVRFTGLTPRSSPWLQFSKASQQKM